MSLSDSPPPLRTKICGITVPEDAEVAVAAGADALGFNFSSTSKRCLSFEIERPWIEALEGKVDRVAVLVNPTVQEISTLVASGCFEFIQFHGDETPSFCEQEGGSSWIKAIRFKNENSFEGALDFKTSYILFDAWSETGYGGTGTRLNWDVTRDFIFKMPDRKVILAGGLTPHNVRDAVRIVRPHAVDVASGVELEPRRKNEYLVREFIRMATTA